MDVERAEQRFVPVDAAQLAHLRVQLPHSARVNGLSNLALVGKRYLWQNKDFKLKTNPLKREGLDEFVKVFRPGAMQNRKQIWREKKPDARWRAYCTDELLARDKVWLDIFGSTTSRWRIRRICQLPTSSRPKSQKTSGLRSSSSTPSKRTSRRAAR